MTPDDIEFPTEYPSQRVAEHEVFLSFNSDWQAEAFHDWWNERGLKAFITYANKRNP